MRAAGVRSSLTITQFVDACILAGFDQIATFPPLVADNQTFSFRSACELVKTARTGFNAGTRRVRTSLC